MIQIIHQVKTELIKGFIHFQMMFKLLKCSTYSIITDCIKKFCAVTADIKLETRIDVGQHFR